MCGKGNISFEINFNDSLKENNSASFNSFSKERIFISREEIFEKLEKAGQRRNSLLNEIRIKNKDAYEKAILKCKTSKAKNCDKREELLKSSTDDIKEKNRRRERVLSEKISQSVKHIEKVTEILSSNEDEKLCRIQSLEQAIIKDLSDKENNRRMIIGSIKENCQKRVSLFLIHFKMDKINELKAKRQVTLH